MFKGTNQEILLHKEYHSRHGDVLKRAYQAGKSSSEKRLSFKPVIRVAVLLISVSFITLYVFFASSPAKATSEDMPIARQWAILRNGEALDEGHILLADDWMLHDPQLGDRYGEDGLSGWVDFQRSFMPDDYDYSVDAHETIDNLIAVMWTVTGTHTADQEGIPATGHSIWVKGITFHLMIDGVISESWVQFDNHYFRYQLGLERLYQSCEPICE